MSRQNKIGPLLPALALLIAGFLCFGYAAIAYKNLQAAAAMPFAVGGFDERHLWWPLSAGIFLFLVAGLVLALSGTNEHAHPSDESLRQQEG